MSEWIKLKAADGHELGAYVARPKGEAIGALVLVQEIFGINAHIRGVADGYAKDGFLVVAPAIFDRFERDLELDYKMQPSCCVAYYPGGIGAVAKEEPSCPVMLHFGANDTHIGKDQVDAVRAAHPQVEIFVYEGAGHAFNRDPDPNSYNPAAAKLARERSLAFLKANIA